MWQKIDAITYQATLNGRVFFLRLNRKTRTRTDKNPRFPCIGRKPRYSTTYTWYNVVERRDGSLWDYTNIFQGQMTPPANLVAAKALASQLAMIEK